ncbi:hypothetical protein BEN78_05030 [Xanthomonas citri pv. mangiferaeindicae]|nr:hypothetical protein BEN78_05030 [Xanthomonas citri pv. mangiferaeindicae]
MSSRNAMYRQVAELHVRCLDRSFLATLGVGFLTLMYRALDESDSTLLLVHREGDAVVGFVTGGASMGPVYKRMLRSPLRLGLNLAPAMLQPSKLRRILEILRYTRGAAAQPDLELPTAELLSLAVAPEWRGRSIAESLYRALEREFRARGVTAFRIVAGTSLAPAHRFYRRMGAEPVAEIEVHDGEYSVVYVQRL